MNNIEEDLDEEFRIVGTKIKETLNYYRDQQADYEQKAAALHKAWDKWDLDALVNMEVITEKDRDKLKPPMVEITILGVAPNGTKEWAVGGYEWEHGSDSEPGTRLLEFLTKNYNSGCDYRIVTVKVPADWCLKEIDRFVNENKELWEPPKNKY